ncbi:MAG: hypothetical protein A3F72_13815 [Bacteroidetes bacterium RIFCSPLOWO2_12_FULL_35_15]|nr:MAG: hypothetical protein A3F72_13815 [Bacteroidetes bacterium RIFCSPLOWO2_12_FULL_35_15]
MKPLLETKKKLSLKLKAFITLFVVIVVLAFVFTLKFSGNSKKDFANLHYSKNVIAPISSSEGGFYKTAFTINLSTIDLNTQIYYTLDGSEPTLASTLYSKPILIEDRTENKNYLSAIPTSPRWKPPIGTIFKGTVLRAIAIDGENKKSAELIKTFFVNEKGNQRYSLPVISITVNSKELFGYNRGIYVLGKSYSDKDNYIRKNIPLDLPWWEYPSNYLMRGADAEREAHIEFYEPSGKLGFESTVGLRIHGNATRGYPQKSLRVCFREKYGQSELNYNLFPANPVKKFSSFILRNSGNDWDKTMFRDGFMQSLMKNSSIDIQDYRPSIVFINAEYWGIHNIRERFDENYLANKYNLSPDSVIILEMSGKLVRGQKGEEQKFTELLNFVSKNDLSIQKNYDYVRSKMEIESFSDFVIANVYFCNSDWPNNNVRFWRYNSESVADSLVKKEGKWRWMLYDTDWGFGYNDLSSPKSNLLEKATRVGSVGILFSELLKNKEFVSQFLDRFQHHLNTSFYIPYVNQKIDQMKYSISPEIQEHIDRWRGIGSYEKWLSNIGVLKDFAEQRPSFQADQLNTFFNLKGKQQIIIKK